VKLRGAFLDELLQCADNAVFDDQPAVLQRPSNGPRRADPFEGLEM